LKLTLGAAFYDGQRKCYHFQMSTIRETIEGKLRNASLSAYEMSIWLDVLGNLDEANLQAVHNFINSDGEAIRMATDSLVAKKEAWNSGDIKRWSKALENDRVIIESA
jgi:hypothetical protein